MAKTPRSLQAWARDKKRAGCPVCSLPADIREQLAAARKQRISRTEQLEWLAAEHGIQLSAAQFDTHNSARHEIA